MNIYKNLLRVNRFIQDTLQLIKRTLISWQHHILTSRTVKINAAVAREREIDQQVSQNPYLQSRVLWNDLYGGIEKKYLVAVRIIILQLVCLFICLLGLIILGKKTHIQPLPYIIRDHKVITLDQQAKSIKNIQSEMVPYFTESFILAARSFSSDKHINKDKRIIAYSFALSNTVDILKQYFQTQVVSQSITTYTINSAITSILLMGPHHVVIRWIETLRSTRTGHRVSHKHYVADIQYKFGAPSDDPSIVKHNPMGFYISELNWSLEQSPFKKDDI